MKVKIDERGLDETVRALMHLPGLFTRARKSAMSSLGFFFMNELRNHVEYGGSGWPGLHPMTEKFWHKYNPGNVKAVWQRRRRGKHNTPLFWLGKFARYRVDHDGNLVQIDFGKSKKGEPGRFDPQLVGIVRRAEEGETIRVTDKMRAFFGATRPKRPKHPEPGRQYFPLKSSTRTLVIPARPIFGPVFRKVQKRIPSYFEKKFWGALERYGAL